MRVFIKSELFTQRMALWSEEQLRTQVSLKQSLAEVTASLWPFNTFTGTCGHKGTTLGGWEKMMWETPLIIDGKCLNSVNKCTWSKISTQAGVGSMANSGSKKGILIKFFWKMDVMCILESISVFNQHLQFFKLISYHF